MSFKHALFFLAAATVAVMLVHFTVYNVKVGQELF